MILINNPLNYLNNKHTIFSIVSEGFDTLEKTNNSYCENFYKDKTTEEQIKNKFQE